MNTDTGEKNCQIYSIGETTLPVMGVDFKYKDESHSVPSSIPEASPLHMFIKEVPMLRMIPPMIADNCSSNAERKVFSALEGIQMDAVVFHSLGIGNHAQKVFGEIDFVVVCSEGILCLEVKGGAVFRKDGVWQCEDRYGVVHTSAEGPFRQAYGNMYALMNYIRKQLPYNHPLAMCLYAYGVVFPDITFTSKGPEIISEIIFDQRDSFSYFKDYIQQVFKYTKELLKEKHSIDTARLGKDHLAQAERILRGEIGNAVSIGSLAQRTDEEILHLTEEQYQVMSMISENDRVLIKGGAGTGKTLLGLEHAKRKAAAGKKVLFLCYNKLLGSFLEFNVRQEPEIIRENITITHFHEYLASNVDCSNVAVFDSEFFNQQLPELFLQACEAGAITEQFDLVILDEGQDLLRFNNLACISEILNGGLESGCWYVFCDPAQNIYNKDFEEGMQILLSEKPVKLNLTTNCRNTQQIGRSNTLISGLRQEAPVIQGEEVILHSYSSEDDFRDRLKHRVKELIKGGVKPGEIVILSPHTLVKSALKDDKFFHSICPFQQIAGCKYTALRDDSLKFCTVHSFKGLDAKVVILIEIEHFEDEKSRELNYIGISRARSLLDIYYRESGKEELKHMMKDNKSRYGLL